MNAHTKHLADLLDAPGNQSTEYVRYLGKLAATGDPDAAPVIAGFLDMPGVVGRCAARSLERLATTYPECFGAVRNLCEERVETSLDADEIENAREVCDALARHLRVKRKAA